MTDTAQEPAVDPESRTTSRRRRNILLIVVAVLVAAAGLSTTLTLRHLNDQYGPIEAGGFGGIYHVHRPDLVTNFDDSTGHLRAHPGAQAKLFASLSNRGAHSVRVTSVETDDIVTDVKWSVYRVVPGGSVDGVSTPWRSFPAIVPANGTIRLLITIHRPAYCDRQRETLQPGVFYDGFHVVHWDSLLGSNTTVIDDSMGDYNINVCWGATNG